MQRRKPLNTTDTKPHHHSPSVAVAAARFYARYVCVLPVQAEECEPLPRATGRVETDPRALYRSTRRVDEFRPDSVGFTRAENDAGAEGKRRRRS